MLSPWSFALVPTFLVLSTSTSICKADCPLNFLQLHNKCYYFSTDRVQWSDSHFRCSSLNATLVTLKSKYNNRKLINYLRNENLDTKEWWIGARYDWKQKQWQWGASGKPVKFNYFVRHLYGRTKLEWHCAFLDRRHHYQWSADPCTMKKYFICMQNNNSPQESDDKDNVIPVIVSRDFLEEQHLKGSNGDNQPAFVIASSASTSSLKPKGNSRPNRPHPQERYACPKGYGSVRKACYKFSKTLATWQEAYFACTGDEEFNGTLAIIPDKKYDRGIRRYAKRIGANVHERWIGGIYDWQKTAWKWAANGVIIQHKEKDRDVLRWHCLIWSPLLTDKWTSDSCVIKKHYICQTSPQAFVPMEMQRYPQSQKIKKQIHQEYSAIRKRSGFDGKP